MGGGEFVETSIEVRLCEINNEMVYSFRATFNPKFQAYQVDVSEVKDPLRVGAVLTDWALF